MGIMDRTRFNLRVWFAVTGFTVIALLTAAFAMAMNSFLTTTMLDREVAVTQEFLQSILATEGYGERGFTNPSVSQDETFTELADHIRSMPEVLRANLYNADGHIVWSTDRALIGQRFENNPELDEAMEGRLVSEVGRLDGNQKPEHVAPVAKALAQGQKEYVALCKGVVREKGAIRRPLVEHGRPHEARTRYTRREVIGGHSRVTVRPDEGRKHQIRRHLASLGHPVIGDERYGDVRTNEYFLMRHFLDRPFLHCARIELELDGRSLDLRAPLAPDLEGVLESLAASESP